MAETTDAGQIDGAKATEEVLAEEAVTDGAPATETQDDGKAARLETELNGYRKVLDTLGIDPDSDVAQKVMAGVIGKDDLVKHIAPQIANRIPPQPETPREPEYAADKLRALMERVEAGDPTQDDFKESLRIINQLVDENNQVQQQRSQQDTIARCTQAMLAPIMDDKYHAELPDDLKRVEEQMFQGGTDLTVGQEARKSPNPQVYFNEKTYGFYADQNKQAYDKLRTHYINMGRKMERGGTPNPNPIEPVAPSTGGAPVEAPKTIPTAKNMRDLAKQYLQGNGQR